MTPARIAKIPRHAVSTLRIIGILSAFEFGTSSWLTMLDVYNLNESQQFLVIILEIVLSGWAVAEASGSHQLRRMEIPLMKLRMLLWCQLGLNASRSIKVFDWISAQDTQRSIGDITSCVINLGIHFLVFAAVLNQLITIFLYSERQRMGQLEDAKLELKHKLRASLMASGVAHEINQPLSTILLNVELMRQEMGKASPQRDLINQRCSQIASESTRVVSTIATMRNLLRSVQTEHTVINLADVIHTALLQERAYLVSMNTQITTSGLATSAKLLGDAGQIQLAISNLIRNASEAIKAAGGSKPHIEISLTYVPNQFQLQVADNGPGFPEECLNKMPLQTTKPEGSGIGLFLVSLTTENHSGSLIVGKSKKLGGAEVTMLLPAINP